MPLILRLAWRNIWRHKRRTLFTALAISAATAVVVFMGAMQSASHKAMIENTIRHSSGFIQIQAKGYLKEPAIDKAITRPDVLAAEVRKLKEVEAVTVRTTAFSLVSSGSGTQGAQVIGVQPDQESTVSVLPARITEGRFLLEINGLEAVLGRTLAKNLGLKVGDKVTLLGSGYDGSIAASILTVVGLFDSGQPDLDRQIVQIPIDTFRDAFSMPQYAHEIVVNVHALEDTQKVLGTIRNTMLQTQGEVAVGWFDLIPGIREMVTLDKIATWFLFMALTLIVTFGVLNTFLMSVLERTKEFGIMMALGLKPKKLSHLIMAETLLLALFGLGIGIAVGGSATAYFSVYGIPVPASSEIASRFSLPQTIQPQVSFDTLLTGPLTMLVLIVGAGLYPAIHIRRLNPLQALRSI